MPPKAARPPKKGSKADLLAQEQKAAKKGSKTDLASEANVSASYRFIFKAIYKRVYLMSIIELPYENIAQLTSIFFLHLSISTCHS